MAITVLFDIAKNGKSCMMVKTAINHQTSATETRYMSAKQQDDKMFLNKYFKDYKYILKITNKLQLSHIHREYSYILYTLYIKNGILYTEKIHV